MTGIELDVPANDTNDTAFSERVIGAVADARDQDPLDLPPLYDVIDLDALDDLFTRNSADGTAGLDRVVFTFAGQEITVYRDGDVSVTEPAPRAGTSVATDGAGERGEAGSTHD